MSKQANKPALLEFEQHQCLVRRQRALRPREPGVSACTNKGKRGRVTEGLAEAVSNSLSGSSKETEQGVMALT